MRNYVRWIIGHRRTVLLLTAAVTAGFALQIRYLEIIVDTDRLLPQSHPYVIATNIAERLFGGRYVVVVALTPRQGNIFAHDFLSTVQALTQALARVPGATRGHTLSIANPKIKDIRGDDGGMSARAVMSKVPETPEDLEALARVVNQNPLLNGVLISEDRRTTAITVDFPTAPDGFQVLQDNIERAVAPFRDDGIDIQITGLPIYLSALEHFSDRMAFLLPLAIFVAALMHYEAFRTIQGLVLPLVTALLAVVWGLGMMIMSGLHQLDPFSNAAPILIIAVAAGHAVQILKRYYEAYHVITMSAPPGPGANRDAVVEAVTAIGPVMIAAGGIGAMSFLSLTVFGIQSIRTFGTFAACGILSALIIELTFIPAIRAMLPPPGTKATDRERTTTPWDRVVAALADLVISRRRIVFALGGILAVCATAGAARLVQNSSLRSFFAADLPLRVADSIVNDRLAGTNRLSILIEGDREDALKEPSVLKAMLATQRYLETSSMVGATVSIADFVARMNRAMHGDDPVAEVIPDSSDLVAQYLLLYSMSGDPDDFDNYVDTEYRRGVIQAFVKTDSSTFVADLDRRLSPFLKDHFGPDTTARIAGNLTATAAMNEIVVQGKFANMAAVAAVVLVMASLMFRSLVAGMLVLVPLAMVALVNFGAMGFLGIPLQVATASVAALGIGVGADYAIYLTYRLRDELRNESDLSAALRRTYATAGKASLYVASAVGGGYAVLMFSWGFKIHLWLGAMMAVAMLVSVLSTLTLYPALLLALKPNFVFRSATETGPAVALPLEATILVLLTAMVLSAGAGYAADEGVQPDAAALMQQSFTATRFKDSTVDATLLLVGSNGGTREWRATALSKLKSDGRDEMRQTRFASASNIKGTVVLSVQNKRPRR